MNENILVNGIAFAISRIKKNNEDPIAYLSEVQKVLNRARALIYKEIDEREVIGDPSELINIMIRGSVKIGRLGSEPVLLDHSRFMLKVYGVRSLGNDQRQLPKRYEATVDITDIFDHAVIPYVRKNCYYFNGGRDVGNKNLKEEHYINEHPAINPNNHSIQIETHYIDNEERELVLTIGGRIPERIQYRKRDEASSRFYHGLATITGISHVDRKNKD